MIVFVGQVAREMREREAFQELDYRAVFGTMAKWATEIDDPARIPEIVSRAFHVATNGRPGPVVIALPEDMLVERAIVPDAPAFEPIETWPGLTDMSRLQKMLWAAKRPVMILGGSRWSDKAWAATQRFAERFDLPVIDHVPARASVRPDPSQLCRRSRHRHQSETARAHQGLRSRDPGRRPHGRDAEPELYAVRHSGAAAALRACASRPGRTRPRLSPDALAINASPTAFAAALEGMQAPNAIPWSDETRIAHADYLAFTEKATDVPGAVNLGEIMVWLREHLSPDDILCNGAGNFSGWLNRFYRLRKFNAFIGPTSGSMGYGVPAAVAMKRLYPDRNVFCLAGDGDFLMNGQEFMTAVQYDLPIVIAIVDNGMYGTIRMHQEREYPGRVVATALKNPDFAAYARAFGGFGATVEKTADFPKAYEAARASGKPAIIHLKVDPAAIAPTMTIESIRSKALAAGTR